MLKFLPVAFICGLMLAVSASEKILVVAEDGFAEYLKTDIHRIGLENSRSGVSFQMSSFPVQDTAPVLRIGKDPCRGDYENVLFAIRGYLFFANGENPVSGLTSGEADLILSGGFWKWSDTLVPLKQICFGGRERFSRNNAGKKDPPWIWINDPELALQIVSEDLTALGVIPLVSAGVVCKKTKLLPVDGVIPSPETVTDGSYPAVKRYYLSIRKDAPESIRKIYNRLQTKQIKEKLWNAGILPAVETEK